MTTIPFVWTCPAGCLPVHMTLPAESFRCQAGHTHLRGTDKGEHLVGLAVVAHMRAVHG